MSGVVRTLAAIACAILGVGALVVGGLAWRLSRGPIPLRFLTPQIEAALGAPDGSIRVDIGSMSLVWDPTDRDIDVRASDVRAIGSGGATVAQVPALTVGIAPMWLLLGTAAPRSVEAIGPRIHLVREADGRLEVGLGTDPTPGATNLLLGAVGGRASRGGSSTLRTVELRDGQIVLDDRASGTTWQATGAALTARRDGAGLTIERLAFDVAPASIVATGHIAGGSVALDATLRTLPTRLLDRWWPGSERSLREAGSSASRVARSRASIWSARWSSLPPARRRPSRWMPSCARRSPRYWRSSRSPACAVR
jgi:hypothetical protein